MTRGWTRGGLAGQLVGTMDTRALRHFRWFARNPVPAWLVVLAVAAVVGFSKWTGAGYEPDPAAEAEIAMRVGHAGLAVEQELDGVPDWMRAVLGLEGAEAVRRSLLDDLEAGGGAAATQADEIQRALLGEPPGGDAELLARLVAKGPSPSEAEWNSLRLIYDGTVLWAWEAEALERLAAENSPDWLAEELAGWRAERILLTRRMLMGFALAVAVLIVGLPFLGLAVKAWIGGVEAPGLLGCWDAGRLAGWWWRMRRRIWFQEGRISGRMCCWERLGAGRSRWMWCWMQGGGSAGRR